MKRTCRYLPVVCALFVCAQFAAAQSLIDFNVGFGAAQDKATTGIDSNTFLNCTAASSSTCATTPSLNGFMLGFGANLMLWKHFGLGGEVNLQPGKQNYALLQPAITSVGQPAITLQSRVTFYDFNGIYQPISSKWGGVQLVGGVGDANVRFYESATGSNALVGAFNSSQYAASSNHFQAHAGIGVQFYVKEHFFIRPQFDIRYVPNFIQFGRNLVTSETVWVGYTFGDRQ